MTRKITTKNGTWKTSGVNYTPADSLYGIIKNAIESGNLRQDYLQQVTGHHGPIRIDISNKTIRFLNF